MWEGSLERPNSLGRAMLRGEIRRELLVCMAGSTVLRAGAPYSKSNCKLAQLQKAACSPSIAQHSTVALSTPAPTPQISTATCAFTPSLPYSLPCMPTALFQRFTVTSEPSSPLPSLCLTGRPCWRALSSLGPRSLPSPPLPPHLAASPRMGIMSRGWSASQRATVGAVWAMSR